jgi:hypothetical protein
MRDFRKLEEAYRNDPEFRQFVKTMYMLIEQLKFSPSEVRDAAMFAVWMHERDNPKPVMMFP